MLKHDWLVKEGVALDITLDSVVRKRMKQFAQLNRLKRMALMVVGQNLSPDEMAGAGWCAICSKLLYAAYVDHWNPAHQPVNTHPSVAIA